MRISSQKSRAELITSARQPRRRRGVARVDALLAAGAAVFAEKGFDAATMTEIAVRAGASIGSLYQFFPTKETLADGLHEADVEALVDMLSELRGRIGQPGGAALADALFAGFSSFLALHPAFVALADRRIDGERKKERRQRLRGALAALLTDALPRLEPSKAEALAVVTLHLMRAVIAVRSEAELLCREAVMDELRAMLRRHLAAAAEAAGAPPPNPQLVMPS